ncbi:hypothetical protein [Arcanobacterium buesumense]|uniref:Uncharacterized protein n=1 Tax=Arcanobacterium buesumense TaxID=2722751 RepID=A0A6H2EHN9_9ACTO|nr:hypothetical protein [Arcanobacterium buesumense]QJC21078.1 hypothetical protein HC352_00130 [Arcanobacterium buesumense]
MPVLPNLKDRPVFKDVDIQFDDYGNMLVQYGQRQGSAQPIGQNPETHKYLRVVSKDNFQVSLNSPLAQWGPSKTNRGEWISKGIVGPSAGRPFGLSSADSVFQRNSRSIASDPVFQGLKINILVQILPVNLLSSVRMEIY